LWALLKQKFAFLGNNLKLAAMIVEQGAVLSCGNFGA
jgi:hypothetical protein